MHRDTATTLDAAHRIASINDAHDAVNGNTGRVSLVLHETREMLETLEANGESADPAVAAFWRDVMAAHDRLLAACG